MGQGPAYFVALDLPLGVREELSLIASGVPGANWVDEDQLHLTLRYLGELDGVVLRDLQSALARIEADRFAMQLRGVGFFPPRGEPNVLWIGVDRCPPLLELRQRVDSIATRIGIKPDRRRFSPHVTLARLRDAPASRLARFAMEQGMFASPVFEPQSFSLYASHRRTTGAEYQRMAVFLLRAPEPGTARAD
jgi:2'-5' RNA ligase